MTDLTAPQPQLAASSIVTLVGGFSLIGAGVALALQVPQARDFCGRILEHPEVQKVGREAAVALLRSVAASLGWSLEKLPVSLTE